MKRKIPPSPSHCFLIHMYHLAFFFYFKRKYLLNVSLSWTLFCMTIGDFLLCPHSNDKISLLGWGSFILLCLENILQCSYLCWALISSHLCLASFFPTTTLPNMSLYQHPHSSFHKHICVYIHRYIHKYRHILQWTRQPLEAVCNINILWFYDCTHMHTIKLNGTNGPVDVHVETLIYLLTSLPSGSECGWIIIFKDIIQAFYYVW